MVTPLYSNVASLFFILISEIVGSDILEVTKESSLPQAINQIPTILQNTRLNDEEADEILKCGDVKCHFTTNKSYVTHLTTRAIIFHGPSLTWDELSPLLPRNPRHEWALVYDETPNTNHIIQSGDILSLFNHTATPQSRSDFPLTLQYIPSIDILESRKYFLSTQEKNEVSVNKNLPLISCLVSNCQGSSDRMNFLEVFMDWMDIHSYGDCFNNIKLPDDLVSTFPVNDPEREVQVAGDPSLLHIIAQYKFTLVLENAICEEYVTEKLWRTFIAGSVPVYLGDVASIKHLLPSNKSLIAVSDYDNLEDLVKYLKFLDENDDEYDEYVSFKYVGVQNEVLRQALFDRGFDSSPDFNDFENNLSIITHFSCMICNRIHENDRRQKLGQPPIVFTASKEHYQCAKPRRFEDLSSGSLKRVVDENYKDDFGITMKEAEAISELVLKEFSKAQILANRTKDIRNEL